MPKSLSQNHILIFLMEFRSATRKAAYVFVISTLAFFISGIALALANLLYEPYEAVIFVLLILSVGTALPFVWFLMLVFSKKKEPILID
jgi:hypothetical protein